MPFGAPKGRFISLFKRPAAAVTCETRIKRAACRRLPACPDCCPGLSGPERPCDGSHV